jgi:hypothetical protein
VRLNALRACAAAGTEERRESLEGLEHLLCTVQVQDCKFVKGDVSDAAKEFPRQEGDVIIEDTKRWPGLVMHIHADGDGATFYVDKRVNSWITRRKGSSVNLVNMNSRHVETAAAAPHSGGTKQAARRADGARAEPNGSIDPKLDSSKNTPAPSEKPQEEEDAKRLPEFMSQEIRESISKPVIWEENLQQIKEMLAESDTACDDLHKFNPTEFDMRNAMRINLKVGAEAPPPEFKAWCLWHPLY